MADQITQPPHPGFRARDIRKRLKLTMDQVGEKAELSKGHLSRFERGEKTLSVASLLRLASALETTVGVLIGEEMDNDEIHLVRQSGEDASKLPGESSDYVFRTLGGGDATQKHNTFNLILPENRVHKATVFHGGRELLYVIAGEVNVCVGKREMHLTEGDYLEFPGSVPHSLESAKGTASVLLIVVS